MSLFAESLPPEYSRPEYAPAYPAGGHLSAPPAVGRAARLDRSLADLLAQAPELEAAAVVSFDGLAMASALPATMDEDRVAAMSAALLSLGEKAAQGLGRGDLSQVYVEGEHGTVFLVSARDEAVLVAVAARGAKVGLMLYEVRRVADAVGAVLQDDEAGPAQAYQTYPEPAVDTGRVYPAADTGPVHPAVEPVGYPQNGSAGAPAADAGYLPGAPVTPVSSAAS